MDNAATVDAGHLSAAGLFLARGSAELSALALDAATPRIEGSARISAFEGGNVDVAGDVVLANTARLHLASLVAGGLVEHAGIARWATPRAGIAPHVIPSV